MILIIYRREEKHCTKLNLLYLQIQKKTLRRKKHNAGESLVLQNKRRKTSNQSLCKPKTINPFFFNKTVFIQIEPQVVQGTRQVGHSASQSNLLIAKNTNCILFLN